MSIKNTGRMTMKTGAVHAPWSNSAASSLHVRLLFDPASTLSDFSNLMLVGHEFYSSIAVVGAGRGTRAATVKIIVFITDSAGGSHGGVIDNIPVGVVHDLCVTHADGSQKAYLNGLATTISSFAGNTQTNGGRTWLMNDGGGGAAAIWTRDDLMAWDGYALSPSDVAALRDGADPLTIGTGATARYRWTMEIPAGKSVGDAVAAGDPGILESLGTTSLNFTTLGGVGSTVYADPLVWVPAARTGEARVPCAGKQAFFFLETISTSARALPTAAIVAPTVTINGVNRGSLTNPLCSGIHEYIHYTMPAGVVVVPGDIVTFDAPVGWATADSGVARGMTAQPANNRAGRSSMGTEEIERTLEIGINDEWYPTAHNALSPFVKNWAKRMSKFSGVVSADATGKPLTIFHTSEGATLYSNTAANLGNGIDATGYPGPTGLFAIGWDDLNPSVPTTFRISSGDATTTTVTERTDLRNPGVGGLRQVRVFDVQRAPGSTVAVTDLQVWVANTSKTLQFDHLIIHGPGDFVHVDGMPVTLDNSDPYALSSWFLDRTRGAGSLRCWYNLLVGASSTIVEPEHVRNLTDFSWGWTNSKAFRPAAYTRADPYSAADTPYFYSPVAGSKYPAKLGADITDPAATSITISDAATAPVIIGLRLFIGSEILRVTNVVGTTVTVIRGAEDTTPTTHLASDTLQVGYRLTALTLNSPAGGGALVKFTTLNPHSFTTGQMIGFGGSGWPQFTYLNGAHDYPWNYGGTAMVTGPNTFVVKLGPYTSPESTLTGPVILPGPPYTCTSAVDIPGGPQIPYAYAAMMATKADVANQFIAVPHAASNDLVRKIARDLRDNSFPGTVTFWVETSNETWNFPAGSLHFGTLTRALYPGATLLASYVKRSDEVCGIMREIFDEGGRNRSGEIKMYLNVQCTNPSNVLLTWAAAQTPPIRIDAIAIAPYVDGGWAGSSTKAMFANLDADQCADLYIHALYYRTDGSTVVGFVAAWQSFINTYNAATGNHCQLVSYEGGLEGVTSSRAKDRDVCYSPAWYFAEQDFYALCQQAGFKLFNVFALSHDWNGGHYLWGLYHHHFQGHGRGDGSDGKTDNRLCLATTKASTTNQDGQNVSVRGQALLDWNRPARRSRRLPFLPTVEQL